MAIARVTGIIPSSPKGFEDAIAVGVKRANQPLKNVSGAWVKDQSVIIEK